MKKVLFILFPILIGLNGYSQTNKTSGGPDFYGYTWHDSKDLTKPATGHWVEIVSPLRAGTIHLEKALPGYTYFGPINFSFDFPYYWYLRNKMYIDEQGNIDFEGHTLGSPYEVIPTKNGQGNDIIAPFLSPSYVDTLDATSGVYFWTDFKDSVIVTWENMPFSAGSSNTFQLILCRKDSSITFQYAKQQGSYDGSCLAAEQNNEAAEPGKNYTCLTIGIENQNGDGLAHSEDPNAITYFTGVTKVAPYIVRYKPDMVSSKNYQLPDLAINYNTNPGSGGKFISKGSAAIGMSADVKNTGTSDVAGTTTLKGTMKKGLTVITTKSISVDPLAKGEDRYITIPGAVIKTDNEGIFGFEAQVINTDDKFSGNNKLQQLISVVDTTKPSSLDYTGGDGSSDFTYLANGPGFQAGIGCYIEPPYYPCIVKAITFNVEAFNQPCQVDQGVPAPTDSIRLSLYDDGGKNVFGIKDGSRGQNVFKKVLIPNLDYKCGPNTLTLSKPYQINSGGVYVGLNISGPTVGFVTEATIPVSYRSYKLVNESFYIFENRNQKDFTMGIVVDKGDVSKTIDLSLTELISPTIDSVITKPIDVKVKYKNTGPQPISGPFDMVYRSDNNQEVRETVPSSLTIMPGEEKEYTFATKLPPPHAPNTQFNKFCTKVYIPNDFVPANDQICYATVGIEENNLIANFDLYPNPTNSGQVNVLYGIIKPSGIIIELVDLNGRVIQRKNAGMVSMGMHHETLNTQDLSEGVYFCRIITDNGLKTEKLVVTK